MENTAHVKKTGKKPLKPLLSTVIIAAAVLGGAFILSKLMVRVQKERVIYAKGVADKLITSDFGVLQLTLTVRNRDLAAGSRQLLQESRIVMDKLKSFGFEDEEIEPGAVSQYEVNRLENGKPTNTLDYYNISRVITLKSDKVDLINNNYVKLSELLLDNLNLSIESPRYFISDQEKHKLELIKIAGESAAARAEMLAGQAGAEVGRLLSARVGIVQITDPRSNDISDYGVYDLSCPVKNMRIVVTMEFAVK